MLVRRLIFARQDERLSGQAMRDRIEPRTGLSGGSSGAGALEGVPAIGLDLLDAGHRRCPVAGLISGGCVAPSRPGSTILATSRYRPPVALVSFIIPDAGRITRTDIRDFFRDSGRPAVVSRRVLQPETRTTDSVRSDPCRARRLDRRGSGRRSGRLSDRRVRRLRSLSRSPRFVDSRPCTIEAYDLGCRITGRSGRGRRSVATAYGTDRRVQAESSGLRTPSGPDLRTWV